MVVEWAAQSLRDMLFALFSVKPEVAVEPGDPHWGLLGRWARLGAQRLDDAVSRHRPSAAMEVAVRTSIATVLGWLALLSPPRGTLASAAQRGRGPLGKPLDWGGGPGVGGRCCR